MEKAQILIIASALVFSVGCNQSKIKVTNEKEPRPVEVSVLQMQPQEGRQIVTATAASWKSEEIEFEVNGRIEWVIEQNTNVEERVVDKSGKVLIDGDPIARIESKQYELLVQKADAELTKAIENAKAVKIEIEESFPAQSDAANADLKLAKIDLDRRVELVDRNAGAQADADKAAANYQNALSKIKQLSAALKSKRAESASLDLQVKIAEKTLADAKRDLRNCVLYSPFPGQIAEVFVVAGSLVGAGNPAVTVQLMYPMKVEFEVSSAESLRLRKRRSVSVLLNLSDGKTEWVDGEIYIIDPVADPQTRTFTVTVLIENENLASEADASLSSVPGVDRVWPMQYQFLSRTGNNLNFLAEECILEDENGFFVWKVDNFSVGQEIPSDRILKVSKLRIAKGDLLLPFLGNWIFRQVNFLDDSIDLEKTQIAGKLSLPSDQANKWNGSQIRFETKRNWKIRPGDVVQVDLSPKSPPSGVFVPMDAIVHEDDGTFLVLLENEENGVASVTQAEVELLPKNKEQSTSSMREIALTSGENIIGRKFVTNGAHFLVEGQKVRIVGGTNPNSPPANKLELSK